MSQMIHRGKELIRISPKDPTIIEYSTSEGRTWLRRSKASNGQGAFIDLTDNGREIIATCQKGLYFSTNEGRTWLLRHRN